MRFETRQVHHINRGGKVDLVTFAALTGEQGRQGPAALVGGPVQNAEHTNHFPGIAPQRPHARIARQAIPLHIVRLGDVP